MSKSKNKSGSELEHLRGENKKLQSENRRLRKEINRLSRRSHFYENIVDEVIEDSKITETCSQCGKGTLILHDFKFVKLLTCDLCEYKEKVK